VRRFQMRTAKAVAVQSQPTLSPREVRQRAGWPLHKLALIAHVGVGTVRLYEANPAAVADLEKREALGRVYRDLNTLVG
jgi:hypothetical protein